MTKHPLDLMSLLAGLLCVAGAAVWLLLERGHVDAEDIVWAAPAALVVLGLAGIASSVRGAASPSAGDGTG